MKPIMYIFYIITMTAIIAFISIEKLFRVKAEVISWKWKVKKPNWEWDDPTCAQPLDISIFVKTRIGKRTLHIFWDRDEEGRMPACMGFDYKMEVMVPLLGRHVWGKWWIDEKDVKRV